MAEFQRSRRIPQPARYDQLIIQSAIVRIVHWRDVPILRADPSRLTALEQFVLEALIMFGTFTHEQFAAVTDLPPTLLHPLTRRLIRAGAATRTNDGYVVVPAGAEAALKTLSVSHHKHARMDFIYLPGSDDLVALSTRNAATITDLFQAKDVVPEVVPVPQSLLHLKRNNFIASRISQGRVLDLPPNVADLQRDAEVDQEAFPGGICLAFTCAATIQSQEGDPHLQLVFREPVGASVRRRGGDEGLQISVQDRTNLADRWLALADLPSTVSGQRGFWEAITGKPSRAPTRPIRVATSRWRYEIDGLTAETLSASNTNLSFDVLVEAIAEDAIAELSARLTPSDQHGRRVFEIDTAIASSHNSGDDIAPLLELIDRATTKGSGEPTPISFERVLARVWSLGHYQLAYNLTETRDFDYDQTAEQVGPEG